MPQNPQTPTLSIQQCLDRSSPPVTVRTGEQIGEWRIGQVPNDSTYRLMGQTTYDPSRMAQREPAQFKWGLYGTVEYDYPINIGADNLTGARSCLVGPDVFGNIDRNATRQYAYSTIGGGGVFLGAGPDSWAHVAMCRIDNVADGIILRDAQTAFRSPGPWTWVWSSTFFNVEHCWLSHIRDDAFELDSMCVGQIHDCLIDGTYAGISERIPDLSSPPLTYDGTARTRLTVSNCIFILERSPNTHNPGPDGLESHIMWKVQPSSAYIRCENTTIVMPGVSGFGNNAMAWPLSRMECSNVDLVLYDPARNLGWGPYPQPLPAGVTVYENDNARSFFNSTVLTRKAQWFIDHGYQPAVNPPQPYPEPAPTESPGEQAPKQTSYRTASEYGGRPSRSTGRQGRFNREEYIV